MPTLRRVVYIPRRRAREGILHSHRLRPGAIVRVRWPDCGLLLCWLGGAEGSDTVVVRF